MSGIPPSTRHDKYQERWPQIAPEASERLVVLPAIWGVGHLFDHDENSLKFRSVDDDWATIQRSFWDPIPTAERQLDILHKELANARPRLIYISFDSGSGGSYSKVGPWVGLLAGPIKIEWDHGCINMLLPIRDRLDIGTSTRYNPGDKPDTPSTDFADDAEEYSRIRLTVVNGVWQFKMGTPRSIRDHSTRDDRSRTQIIETRNPSRSSGPSVEFVTGSQIAKWLLEDEKMMRLAKEHPERGIWQHVQIRQVLEKLEQRQKSILQAVTTKTMTLSRLSTDRPLDGHAIDNGINELRWSMGNAEKWYVPPTAPEIIEAKELFESLKLKGARV